MAFLKAAEVRSMAREDRLLRLQELREMLMHERGVAAMGGSPPSPGKIRQLRTAIARIHTINRLEALQRPQYTKRERVAGAASPPGPTPAKPKSPPPKASAPKAAAGTTAKQRKPSSKEATEHGGKTGGHG